MKRRGARLFGALLLAPLLLWVFVPVVQLDAPLSTVILDGEAVAVDPSGRAGGALGFTRVVELAPWAHHDLEGCQLMATPSEFELEDSP